MLALRDFIPADDDALIAWAPTAEALMLFAGSTLAFPLTAAQLHALRDTPHLHTWTAYVGPDADVPVGHAELLRTGSESGRLARIVVDPARRGAGLGRALVAAAIERAEALALRRLSLRVYDGNDAAIRTYLALGFTDAGPLPGDRSVRIFTRAPG
ncbi:MAG TPA: GNAT family N-acetyltransferase [Baekduia sp.]|nr:GNAT family N-acetyltransferase [Baekduia sp.]